MGLKNLWLDASLEIFLCGCMPEHCGSNKSRGTLQRTDWNFTQLFYKLE